MIDIVSVGIRAKLVIKGSILLLDEINGGSAPVDIAMEKLVGNNYNYWKLCMEAYLQGQDLWDLIPSPKMEDQMWKSFIYLANFD